MLFTDIKIYPLQLTMFFWFRKSDVRLVTWFKLQYLKDTFRSCTFQVENFLKTGENRLKQKLLYNTSIVPVNTKWEVHCTIDNGRIIFGESFFSLLQTRTKIWAILQALRELPNRSKIVTHFQLIISLVSYFGRTSKVYIN